MHILMTTDTVGGVWTYSLELAAALQSHDVQIDLATMGEPLNDGQWQAVGRLPHVQVHESSFKLEWQEDPWADVSRAGEWLLALERECDSDLVHLNGYAHGALPWQSPVLVVGHSCVLSWWEAVRGASAPPEWQHYRELVTDGLRCADLVVAPSRTMLEALVRHYGPFARTQVIYNARDPRHFFPQLKDPLVFASGRVWDEAKNLGALERLAPHLPWPLYLAGENRAPDGGLATVDNTRYLGRLSQPQIADWFARAGIYVHPARYEPFGLCVLEAALSGCAMVLGDIASLRELWDGAALFVPPGDEQGLLRALSGLIAEDHTRERLAGLALRRARRFAPAVMAEQYLAVYDSLQRETAPRAVGTHGGMQHGP